MKIYFEHGGIHRVSQDIWLNHGRSTPVNSLHSYEQLPLHIITVSVLLDIEDNTAFENIAGTQWIFFAFYINF